MAKFSGINGFNPELQALVKSHFMGEISRLDYRRQRRDLIDRIIDSEEFSAIPDPGHSDYSDQTDHIDLDSDEDEQDSAVSDTQPYDSETGQFQWNSTSNNQTDSDKSNNKKGAIDKWFVVAIIIIIAYLGFSLFKGSKNTSPLPLKDDNKTGQSDIQHQPKQLIEQFAQLSTWSDVEIDRFIRQWQEIPKTTRKEAKNAPWFHEFNLQIKNRYEQQKKHAQTGSGDAARKQLILLQLANEINT